jgi:signal transduction histidine kinase
MIRKLLKRKLGLRLALVCFILSLVIAVIITSIMVLNLKQRGLQQANQLFTQIEQSFIPALTDALWTMDPIRTKSQIDALSHLPSMGHISLTDASGSHTDKELVKVTEILGQKEYELSISIDGEHFRLGRLIIVLDSSTLNEQISEVWKISLLSSFVVSFVSSLLLVLLFHNWVVLQLQQVSAYASQLNAQNLSNPLILKRPTSPDDEVGAIVLALTEMQQQLLKEFEKRALAEDELKAYQLTLETMVADRTQQLAEQTQELEYQSKILAEQNSELNAFAHTVAHDLKHPITSLIGLSTLLSKAYDSFSQNQKQDFLQQIMQSSIKMNSMINGLLQMASLRSDQQPDKSIVDINLSVKEAMKHLASLIYEHNSTIVVHQNMPQLLTHGLWVEEIWLNYISNAVKYGGEQAKIAIGFHKNEVGSHYIFWVEDNGPGINKDQSETLFTEFSRLHTIRQDSHGLGLSIVRRICNKLGGQCGYEPGAAGGSRFWFSLPF